VRVVNRSTRANRLFLLSSSRWHGPCDDVALRRPAKTSGSSKPDIKIRGAEIIDRDALVVAAMEAPMISRVIQIAAQAT
jgi:hypothetical protein